MIAAGYKALDELCILYLLIQPLYLPLLTLGLRGDSDGPPFSPHSQAWKVHRKITDLLAGADGIHTHA